MDDQGGHHADVAAWRLGGGTGRDMDGWAADLRGGLYRWLHVYVLFSLQVMLAAGISLFSFFFSPLGGDGGNTGHVGAVVWLAGRKAMRRDREGRRKRFHNHCLGLCAINGARIRPPGIKLQCVCQQHTQQQVHPPCTSSNVIDRQAVLVTQLVSRCVNALPTSRTTLEIEVQYCEFSCSCMADVIFSTAT